MDDNKFTLILVAIIASAIVAVSAIIAGGCCRYTQIMTEGGYEEVTLPGKTGVAWQKVK
jgi:hypothetical protein